MIFKFHYSNSYPIDAQILYYRAVHILEFLLYQETDLYSCQFPSRSFRSSIWNLGIEILHLLREAAWVSVVFFVLFDFCVFVLFLSPLTVGYGGSVKDCDETLE